MLLKPDRRLRVDPHRAAEIEIALDVDLDVAQLDPHRRGHHPQRDLLAGRQRCQQQIAGAGQIALATGHRVGAGFPRHAVAAGRTDRGYRAARRIIAGRCAAHAS